MAGALRGTPPRCGRAGGLRRQRPRPPRALPPARAGGPHGGPRARLPDARPRWTRGRRVRHGRAAPPLAAGRGDGRGHPERGARRTRVRRASHRRRARRLRVTAEYTVRREQFDRPIASFQAVHQRAADAYIDVEAIRLTTWQAAWRLAAGLPASAAVAVAKFWASEAAHRVVYAAQHLHGGIGVDVDYPLHRYYLWSKQIELTLGSGTRQLARLGADLAR